MDEITGSRIKMLRDEHDMSQQELADKLKERYGLKTHRVTIAKWESGKQAPEMYSVKCLAEFFNVTMEYITGNSNSRGEEHDDDYAIREELKNNPKLRMLLSASSGLSDEDMQMLISIAKKINKEYE